MKHLILFLLICIAFSFEVKEKCKNSKYLLEQSKKYHDPAQQWEKLVWNLHIQEPRVENPSRYSVVHLNNENGIFELQRSRETSISTHQIDEVGNAKVLLDNQENFSAELTEKYRLDAARNTGYRRFYQLMYGLPMSLNEDDLVAMKDAETTTFKEQAAYKIEIELKEAMISKHWRLYLSTFNYQMLGLELFDPEDDSKGERIVFDQDFEYKNLRLPRMRHWHDLKTNEYGGSDIIIKAVE